MKTFIPNCATICSNREYLANKLGKLSPDVRKTGVSDIQYSQKQLDNAAIKVSRYGVAGVTCGVIEFEEIGTYISYSYMICNAILDDLRGVMTTSFREVVKELSLDPLQLQKNFNPWFIHNDKVQLKMNRVSREL